MSISTAKSAYRDCFEIFDQALEADRGIRIGNDDKGAAMQLVTRLQYARTLDRRDSREMYNQGDPGYNTSVYDSLVIRRPRLEDDMWWVYIERRAFGGVIEILGAAE